MSTWRKQRKLFCNILNYKLTNYGLIPHQPWLFLIIVVAKLGVFATDGVRRKRLSIL
jgi:hypothetical protein